jgi:hypothetical protein
MLLADQPNSAPNSFGLGDYARLVYTFTVPAPNTCMMIDFQFLSEEFPEFVGSQFNDYFEAYLDGVSFARDAQGNRITINTAFGVTPFNASGSTYDASTPRLRAQVEVTPGATSVLSFTIADVSDTGYDSAVFLDNIRFSRPGGRGCNPGAGIPASISFTKSVAPSGGAICPATSVVTAAEGSTATYCYAIQNTGDYTLTTHTLTDDQFGPLLINAPVMVPPGGTYVLTRSAPITGSLISTATWVATAQVTSTAYLVTATSTTNVLVGSPGSADLSLTPPRTVIRTGMPVTVALVISGMANVGSFETQVNFNPQAVTITQVTYGPFLGSSGRTVLPFTPVIGSGTLKLGAATLGTQAGPSGNGTLVYLRVVPLTNTSSMLSLTNVLVSNAAGKPATLTLHNGALAETKWVYIPLVQRITPRAD